MTWEMLFRIAEVAFAAGGAIMYVRSRLEALDRSVRGLEETQGRLGKRVQRVERLVRRVLHRPGPPPA